MRRLAGSLLVLLATSCGYYSYESEVRHIHAMRYACYASTIEIAYVAELTWEAIGCGHRAVYVCRRGTRCSRDGESMSEGRGSGEMSERERRRIHGAGQ